MSVSAFPLWAFIFFFLAVVPNAIELFGFYSSARCADDIRPVTLFLDCFCI